MSGYDGYQYVGIDLHRRRSVIVRQTADGMQLSAVRIANDPVALGLQDWAGGQAPGRGRGGHLRLVLAVDVLQAAGAEVHLAHPLGVKGFAYRRVKNDIKEAPDQAGRCAWGVFQSPGSPRPTCGICANWSATGPNWWP